MARLIRAKQTDGKAGPPPLRPLQRGRSQAEQAEWERGNARIARGAAREAATDLRVARTELEVRLAQSVRGYDEADRKRFIEKYVKPAQARVRALEKKHKRFVNKQAFYEDQAARRGF